MLRVRRKKVFKKDKKFFRVNDQIRIPEVMVIDDGSSDESGALAEGCNGVRVVRHPVNSGYGRTLKTGILGARYDWIAIADADGTYPIEELDSLIERMDQGFDMVVGCRQNVLKLDRPLKRMFRRTFIGVLSFLLNQRIEDPNSGFRIFKRDLAMEYFPFLCDAFSFTTSLTVFAFGSGYRFVSYVPITYEVRTGDSKVRHVRDSMRTAQLIVQGITYSNPVKFFLMLAVAFLGGVAVPAGILSLVDVTWANYFFVTGVTVSVLVGMGVMCDTIRIAITRASRIDGDQKPLAQALPEERD